MGDTQTIVIKGERFVVVPESEYLRLLTDAGEGPPLPPADADGLRPALATARALLARQMVRDRKAAGLTQTELAELAGVRQETISRIESGKHSPTEKTVERLQQALEKPGTRRSRRTG